MVGGDWGWVPGMYLPVTVTVWGCLGVYTFMCLHESSGPQPHPFRGFGIRWGQLHLGFGAQLARLQLEVVWLCLADECEHLFLSQDGTQPQHCIDNMITILGIEDPK